MSAATAISQYSRYNAKVARNRATSEPAWIRWALIGVSLAFLSLFLFIPLAAVFTEALRKGFETSVLLYGPGVTLGVQRGFPKIGDEAFPGHLAMNGQLVKFMREGGKVFACRFALQALYGHGEPSLIEGIRPISPLDVLDLILLHRRDSAFIINTWTL